METGTFADATQSPCQNGDCCVADYSHEKCGLDNRDVTHDGIFFGNYDATEQQVKGSLFIGGNAKLKNVDVGIEDTAVSDLLTRGRSDLTVAGNVDFDCGAHYGPIFHGGTVVEKDTKHFMPHSQVTGLPEKNLREQAAWQETSARWGTKVDTGSFQASYSNQLQQEVVVLVGGNSSPEVFSITCTDLFSKAVAFRGFGHNPDFVLVNVKGQCMTSMNKGFDPLLSTSLYDGTNANDDPSVLHDTSKKVLWNFVDTTRLSIATAWEGTILAPLASVTGSSGIVFGQVIAKSWNGNTELSHRPFEGCTDLDPCGNLAEPGTSGCPGHPMPEPCFNARLEIPEGDCCPNWVCDVNCDLVPCAMPMCVFGYDLVVTSKAGSDTSPCCDVVACKLIPDSIPPTITGCPADINIVGDDNDQAIVSWPEISITDNLAVNSVVYSRSSGSTFDMGENPVTVTATDAAGNTAVCAFVVNVVVTDTTPPVLINVPMDAVLECGESVMADNEVTAEDIHDVAGVVEISIVEQKIAGACSSMYMIVRTWTATDGAGNSASATQSSDFRDSSPPVFSSSLPASITHQGTQFPPPPAMTASDVCDGDVPVEIMVTEVSASEIKYQFTATDGCGNAAELAQTVTLVVSDSPTDEPVTVASMAERIPAPDHNLNAECGKVPPPVDLDPDLFVETAMKLVSNCETEMIHMWSTETGEVVFTQTISVFDTTPPFIKNAPKDIVGAIATPSPAALTAVDGCSGSAVITFEEEMTEAVLTRTWTATDTCGLTATHVQTILFAKDYCVDGDVYRNSGDFWEVNPCTTGMCQSGEISFMAMDCMMYMPPYCEGGGNAVWEGDGTCCGGKFQCTGCNMDFCPQFMCMPGYDAIYRKPPAGSCCPETSCEPIMCASDVQLCPDGVSTVSRLADLQCNFAECPEILCLQDVLRCTDGSYVSRILPGCSFASCPDPCIGVSCGTHGACGGGQCKCADGWTGTNCEVAPDMVAADELLVVNSFIAPKNPGPAFKCDHGICRSTTNLGIGWYATDARVNSVLAVDNNAKNIFAVDQDGFIIKSVNSGASWQTSVAIQQDYLNSVQYDKNYNHRMTSDGFHSHPPESEDAFVPPVFDFTSGNGESYYVTKSGIFGYTADRAYGYYTSWSATTAAKTIIYCYDRCKDVECGDYGRCSMAHGSCICYEGWFGTSCESAPFEISGGGGMMIGGRRR